MIKIKNLNKTYKTKKTNHHALKGINLDFSNTGLNFILGKSGCGKTTLMNMIGGLDKFDEGDIIIKHLSLATASKVDKDRLRNTVVGFIFQDFNLLENMTVFENVSVALKLIGNYDADEEKKLAEKALADVGLDKLGNRKINELSGGQKQRVAIARALIKKPDILLCDEPTGNLDDDTSNSILELLKEISRKKLVIIVSHNDKLAYHYGDRVISMLDGSVIKDELTGSDEVKETKSLEYSGNYSSKEVTKEVIKTIGNNSIVHASFENEHDEKVSNTKLVKTKKYDSKNVNMFTVLFKTAFGYFTLRKLRLVILTILMSVSLAVGAFMISMYTYDGVDDTINYLEKHDFALNRVTCQSRTPKEPFDSGLCKDYIINSELGEGAIAYNARNVLIDDYIDVYIDGMSMNDYYNDSLSYILVDPSADLLNYFDLAEGSSNITDLQDIFITDRIAHQIDPNLEPKDHIGNTLSSSKETFTIKGVILTDYEEVDFAYNPYYREFINDKYNVILYNIDYAYSLVKDTDLFDANGIKLSLGGTDEYYNGTTVTRGQKKLAKASEYIGSYTSLLVGRAPTASNEIVVSKSYMCEVIRMSDDIGLCNNQGVSESEIYEVFESYLGKTYSQYTLSRWDNESIAFDAAFNDGVIIVGVTEDYKIGDDIDMGDYTIISNTTVDILLSDEGMELFTDNYVIANDIYVLLHEDEYRYFTEYMYEANSNDDVLGSNYILSFSTFDATTIVSIDDASNLQIFVVIVLAITFVFTTVSTVMSNFNLNFIVENKKKEVGIFKAQGYRNKQLYTLFIIIVTLQTILVTVISTILTVIALWGFNTIYNSLNMRYSGYDFMTFDFEEFIYLFICTFVFSMLSLFRPLKNMAKTEPIDVIKNL